MKKIFCLLGILGWMLSTTAQSSLPAINMTSSNQQLIEDAVKDGIFVVHRCYQLQDTTAEKPIFYGWNNKNFFGESYSLAIKVKEGYCLNDLAFRPWIYDKKFDEYAESAQFAPVISESKYRALEDTVWKSLPYQELLTKEMATHRIYLAQDSVFLQKGFSIDYSDGVKKGWVVWLVADKSLMEDSQQIPSFLVYRTELTFEPRKESYEIKDPLTKKSILAGYYVVPETTEIGQIVFHLAGIVHQDKEIWQVVRMNNAANSNITKSKTTGSSLTPIDISKENEVKKNKKK